VRVHEAPRTGPQRGHPTGRPSRPFPVEDELETRDLEGWVIKEECDEYRSTDWKAEGSVRGMATNRRREA